MTRLNYLADTYKFTDTATVLDVLNVEDETVVILDQTIFYPQGGGQPYDTGTIGDFKVTKVRLQPDGTVYHYGMGDVEARSEVELKVETERRLLNARIHTAGHLVDIAAAQVGIDLKPTKGFHDPAGSYVEYEGALEVSEALISDLETSVNQLVQSNIKVMVEDLSPAEAEARGVWAPPGKSARFVYFEGYEDQGCGCGGTHVTSTVEIGHITIRKIKSKKGVTRVSYMVN